MQNLREDHGVETHLRALRYLSIRLKSRPATANGAPEVDAAREDVKAKSEAYDEALEQRVAATAEIEYLDGRLDGTVIGLGRDVLGLVNGDRSDARYLKLFPVAPTTMMKPVGGDTQATYVSVILDRIADDDDLSTLRNHLKPIRQQLDALEKATKARRLLTIAENKAAADRRLALEDARRVYRLMHPRLLLQFPDDSALVESYFAKLSATRVRDAVVPADDAPADA
jgi:hypothetical protein